LGRKKQKAGRREKAVKKPDASDDLNQKKRKDPGISAIATRTSPGDQGGSMICGRKEENPRLPKKQWGEHLAQPMATKKREGGDKEGRGGEKGKNSRERTLDRINF